MARLEAERERAIRLVLHRITPQPGRLGGGEYSRYRIRTCLLVPAPGRVSVAGAFVVTAGSYVLSTVETIHSGAVVLRHQRGQLGLQLLDQHHGTRLVSSRPGTPACSRARSVQSV